MRALPTEMGPEETSCRGSRKNGSPWVMGCEEPGAALTWEGRCLGPSSLHVSDLNCLWAYWDFAAMLSGLSPEGSSQNVFQEP